MFTWPNMNVVIVTDEDYTTVDETCEALGIKPEVPPRAAVPKPPCTVCAQLYEQHGSFPTCASHPYSPDGRCGHVGALVAGAFVGAQCPGDECKDGCALAHGAKGSA